MNKAMIKRADITIEKIDAKYVVMYKGRPFAFPSSGGPKSITQFDHKEDAEKYASIVLTIANKKTGR